jgi:para-aminobenzoate synthetase component 1
MQALIHEVATPHSPESLAGPFAGEPGLVLLRSGLPDSSQSRYSFIAARPFLTFRSFGSRCEVHCSVAAAVNPQPLVLPPFAPLPIHVGSHVQFGNPWHLLDELMGRYELLDEVDLPFPLGGCFGFWGYDLKNFVEPKLPRRTLQDLGLPDCHVGFYDSLVAFDHHLDKAWVIATGLAADGSRSEERAREGLAFWQQRLAGECGIRASALERGRPRPLCPPPPNSGAAVSSNLSRTEFLTRIEQAQRYIRAGDIYQVNLSQRLAAPLPASSWEFFARLSAVSPAPFAAFLDCGEFQLASSSPELFLRLSGRQVRTRPIKGTRPRSQDADEDARLSHELQTSAKENAELVMITDLLRNDLGRVCEYGSVQVPDLMRLERYAQVQHLVATVEGCLRTDVTHLAALASCFPGGSITGAPKFRALELIDELEPTARGPFTGALGYLGFNRESQLSIIIRTALCHHGRAHFPVGAGIVADSQPEAEYAETLAKAAGFLAALPQQEGQVARAGAAPLQPPATGLRLP